MVLILPSHLPRRGDPFDDSEADDDPGHQQRQRHLDVEAAALCNGAGGVQSLTIPEIGCGRAFVTLRLHDCVVRREGGGTLDWVIMKTK